MASSMKVVWLVCTVRPRALDDAGSERGLETERIADGKNFLAHLQCGGVAEREGDKFLSLGIDLDQSDIVALVGADELRGVVRLVTQNDFDGLSAFDKRESL